MNAPYVQVVDSGSVYASVILSMAKDLIHGWGNYCPTRLSRPS